MEPLLNNLGFRGSTEWCNQLLQGEANLDHITDPLTTEILKACHQIRESLPAEISFDEMLDGFHKFPAKTTTSPSGIHLNINHTLIKTYHQPLTAETAKQQSVAKTSLKIQWMIMNLTIKHCHTYERWKTVHNNFLEKIPGYPLLGKLRVIHIYKANWNYILKYFIAKSLLRKASKENTTQHEQAGGHPRRSAIDMAIQTILVFECCRLLMQILAKLFLDSKACYNRVLVLLSNLA